MTDEMNNKAVLNRRHALKTVAAGALTFMGVNLLARAAQATPATTAQAVTDLSGEGKVMPAPAALKLTLPEIAEDGSQVQITVNADGPMPDGSKLRTIHILAEDNPLPQVVSFKLSPLLAKTSVTTRIRLAQTENVVVLAITEKGTAYTASKNVKVTIGGCGG